jgi:hypothetical protein
MRANHPLRKTMGINPNTEFTAEQADVLGTSLVTGIFNLLNGPQQVLRYLLGGALRHQYGLSRGRDVVSARDLEKTTVDDVSDSAWDPEDATSLRGYEDVDIRLTWESVRSQAPPKQREAMDIYWEARTSGRTVDEVSLKRGRKPVVVRNNLAALKRKLRGQQPAD